MHFAQTVRLAVAPAASFPVLVVELRFSVAPLVFSDRRILGLLPGGITPTAVV